MATITPFSSPGDSARLDASPAPGCAGALKAL